jgi:hypothetical protein
MNLFAAIIGMFVLIIVMEFLLWRLFVRNISGIVFPRTMDTSSLRFFTFNRMRLFVTIHAIVLLAITGSTLFFLW